MLRASRSAMFLTLLLTFAVACAHAQLQLGSAPASPAAPAAASSLTDPGYNADVQVLLDADKQFAADVLKGGGAAFAQWFAEDAITLSNGKAAVEGKAAITRDTTWKASEYQLTWTPDGARIGPSRDMGVTWGSYQGHSKDHEGNSLVTSGRYITVWKKDSAGKWKVLLDASNDAPPDAGSCCSIR